MLCFNERRVIFIFKIISLKQKRDMYEMHKYWGKKPSSNLGMLVREYSNEGDIVFDPFSGYGVFCCEAFILNRNVISNDLNPVANFINHQLFCQQVDLKKVQEHWKNIKVNYSSFINDWFGWNIDDDRFTLTSVLRNKDDLPIKAKYKVKGGRKAEEIEIKKVDAEKYLEYESNRLIDDWYPETSVIENSRISAYRGMTVSSLFTKRTLSCHAKLLNLIEEYSDGKEQELLKLAFTANLANCSDRKSTRLNSSHPSISRMPSSA